MEALRAFERVHRAFTELNTSGATIQQIVSQIAELADAPVFLKNLAQKVLAFAPRDSEVEQLLATWERKLRLLGTTSRTDVLSV